LLEPRKIVRGIQSLVVLDPELFAMRRRKRIEDHGRIVARILRPGRL
jgi:hypothetical protein